MAAIRTRREPPPFRRVSVAGTEAISPWMTRVFLTGPSLKGFDEPTPASSVRLLLPSPGAGLVVPIWAGNEFLLPDGSRPVIRTVTPRRFIAESNEIHLDIVHHDGGALTPWVKDALAGPAADAAVSGPGRGYEIPSDANSFILIGDETAIPAICQLLERIPDVPIEVLIGVRDLEARVDLHRDVDEHWIQIESGGDLGPEAVTRLSTANLREDLHIWAAGEAAAMQAIRKYLFTERGLPRDRTTIRGYWKSAA